MSHRKIPPTTFRQATKAFACTKQFAIARSAECFVKANAQGHSVAEVGRDTFIENFSKYHGGMSYHKIPQNLNLI
jgi:hypothetical protein